MNATQHAAGRKLDDMNKTLAFASAEAARPSGREARFQLRAIIACRRRPAPRCECARARHRVARRSNWCACSMTRTSAVGPWHPHLDPAELQVGLRHMLLTRIYDDRMQRTQRAGKISFYMRSLGEEAVSVAQCMALRPGDMLFPSYRNQGLQIARGIALVDLMCQLLSNTRDMCKGRQLPVMYHSKAGNIFSISGNLATQFPQAVGWAMAAAIKGEDQPGRELDRRGQQRGGGFSSCAAVRFGVPGAGHSQRGEQSVGHLDLPGLCRRRAALVRGARSRLRHRRHPCRRQRLSRGVCGHPVGGGARAHRRRTHVDRAGDLSRRRAFDQRRSGSLSRQGRSGALAARRSDRAAQAASDQTRRVVGGASSRARPPNSRPWSPRAGRRR